MQNLLKLAILCSLYIMTLPANAGLILQDEGRGSSQVYGNSVLGQWFTTEDTNVKIAFAFIDMNPHFEFLPQVTMHLYEGIGFETGLLGSVLLNLDMPLAKRTWTFVDFNFSFLDLTVGKQYTAIISAPNERWGVKVTLVGVKIPTSRAKEYLEVKQRLKLI